MFWCECCSTNERTKCRCRHRGEGWLRWRYRRMRLKRERLYSVVVVGPDGFERADKPQRGRLRARMSAQGTNLAFARGGGGPYYAVVREVAQ